MSKKILFICFLAIIIFIGINVAPKILTIKGKQCYKQGDMTCAAEYFKSAHMIAPKRLEYEYYYTRTLSKLKPTYNNQKEMYHLYKNAKSKSAKNLAKSTINNWKSSILGNIGSNYIEQVPSDADIVRWNKESFPLNVCVRKDVGVPEYYDYAINRALALWTNSIEFVKFNRTNDVNKAQIIIEIKPLPGNTCINNICQYVTGYTSPIRSGHTLKNMVITLYDKEPSGMYFTDDVFFHTISHELGHALGIMGHSYSSNDLMYTTQQDKNSIYSKYHSNLSTLTGRDVNTVKLLYRLEPTVTDKISNNSDFIYAPIILGSRDDMLDKKIIEAQNYIKKSPTIASGYIDLSSAYLQKGKPKVAEDILLQGLQHAKSTEEMYIIYYNLSLVACSSKQFSKAQNYLNKARQIKNSPELAEVEYFIQNKIVPSL